MVETTSFLLANRKTGGGRHPLVIYAPWHSTVAVTRFVSSLSSVFTGSQYSLVSIISSSRLMHSWLQHCAVLIPPLFNVFSAFSQEHVGGRFCDTCHRGYHTLERRNSLGCLPCACDAGGTVPGGRCDERTGQCPCREGVEGLQCTDCAHRYYYNRSSQLQGKRPLWEIPAVNALSTLGMGNLRLQDPLNLKILKSYI